MSDIEKIISAVDSVSEKFNSNLNDSEKKLLDEVIILIKGLSVANGKIATTVENLKLVTKIKSKLADAILNKDYLSGVKELVKGFDSIYREQIDYFSNNFQKADVSGLSEKLDLIKKIALENTMSGLTKSGIESNVIANISNIILKSVTSGGMYSDLVSRMTEMLTSTEKSDGELTRYAKTYTTTALNQYAGQNNKIFTDDLGVEWFQYVGSNKETTREFCEHLTKKRYIHRSEIPEIVSGIIDGHQCKIYDKTKLPLGMIEGTNADNFEINNGGWGCGHKLTPVNKDSVPKNIRNKF